MPTEAEACSRERVVMHLLAGIDIGNATTEIVIADADNGQPVAWDRVRTQGAKGSVEAARRAGRLLHRMQARLGSTVQEAILTPQVPVHTSRIDVPVQPPSTGRLRILASSAATPGGVGFAVGRPVDLMTLELIALEGTGADPAARQPIIAVSRDPLGFRQTVTVLRHCIERGIPIRGLLLAGDEATLVARRLEQPIPIIDAVDPELALSADAIAMEVAAPGRTCAQVGDPLRLAGSLGLAEDEHHHARHVATALAGRRCAAVACLPTSLPQAPANRAAAVHFADGASIPILEGIKALERRHAQVIGYRDGQGREHRASDLWLVDPDALLSIPGLPDQAARAGRAAISAIYRGPDRPDDHWDHQEGLRQVWQGPIRILGSEPEAARAGALHLGAGTADALVVDLGGGTVDVIDADGQTWTGAGSGDLLTLATAIATDTSRATAEWVKRGPAWRIESPHLAIDESDDRRFLDQSAAGGSVGWLVTAGPSGALPFSRSLTLGQWRTLRMALKEQVFGRNLRRALQALSVSGERDIVLVGGPAGDEEILAAMHAWIPDATFGRAEVAGLLGHRWAVAYGLVLLARQH